MKFFKNKKFILFTSISLVFLFVAAPVLARYQPYPPMPRIKGEQTATPSSSKKDQVKDNIRDKKLQASERLSEAKLKICNKLEDNIKKRSNNLVSRVNRHIVRFDRISDKVQDFYTRRMIPKGIIVENYEALTENIDAKGAAAEEAAKSAAAVIDNIDCNGDNPKEVLTNFRDQMQNTIKALKDYRKSVVDLIVAVRTAFNNAKDKEATSSSGKEATGSAN